LQVVGNMLASIPDAIDADRMEQLIIGLLVACAVAAVVVLRIVHKVVTRLLLLGLLFAVGVGLWLQREQLQDCSDQCSCQVFGQDVRVDDVPGLDCPG
jgi:hypothetical protein